MREPPHFIHELPVLVLFPHNRCNCRCVMCDIWRIREQRNLRPDDLRPHLASMRSLHVRWVVFSGGEAQLNSELPLLAEMLRGEGIRLTLLTAGLLLQAQAAKVARLMDDVIVSLDGPPEVHDAIRRVPRAFSRLAAGVAALRELRPDMPVSARTTVQRANHNRLCETVETARSLALTGISFLAADLTSQAFNRPQPWPGERCEQLALSGGEVAELEREVERLVQLRGAGAPFIAESPEKLRRLVLHFRAARGEAEPRAPLCNAPWVSAVIEADGAVRPCFFHPPIGNIHDAPLLRVLNGPRALRFRGELDVANDPVCRRCVCSLYRPSAVAATG